MAVQVKSRQPVASYQVQTSVQSGALDSAAYLRSDGQTRIEPDAMALDHPLFSKLSTDTSLAFLPTLSFAVQLQASRYLSVASLAAFIWDLICTMDQDICLLDLGTLNWPVIVYFISRISSLAHITTTTVFHVAPVVSCKALPIAIGWCWAVAIPSTSLLFFFRVRAVFYSQRLVVAFFGILWLTTLAGAITVPFAIFGGHIPHSDRCVPTAVKPFSSAGIIASTCNDTLIFVAIAWNIIMRTTVKGRIKSFFFGRDLPRISKEFLQGGQQYYLIAVAGNVLIMAVILSPSPPLVRDMFPVLDMALENSMACRVFRNIKLGGEINIPHRRISENEQVLPTSDGLSQELQTFESTLIETKVENEAVIDIGVAGRYEDNARVYGNEGKEDTSV